MGISVFFKSPIELWILPIRLGRYIICSYNTFGLLYNVINTGENSIQSDTGKTIQYLPMRLYTIYTNHLVLYVCK